jgi:triphosphoribosyl-dephospho-CoA synthase
VTFYDFVASSVAIGPAMQDAPNRSLGQTVLRAIQATRALVSTNTNLGTVLLLAPLATVPRAHPLSKGVPSVLDRLTPRDSAEVYEAIRLAGPGGLGQVDQADVAHRAPDDLRDAMALAADRDLVARQYANGFREVLDLVLPSLTRPPETDQTLIDRIIHTHLRLMSQFPDSLIARKCGPHIARQAADHAAAVLRAGQPGDEAYHGALAELDFWLRCDHHRRNPGTTADLVAAGLFAGLRDGLIQTSS